MGAWWRRQQHGWEAAGLAGQKMAGSWVSTEPLQPRPHTSSPSPYLILQDEVASTVEWMLVQICLCRKYKKLGQQGIQKKMLPLESS